MATKTESVKIIIGAVDDATAVLNKVASSTQKSASGLANLGATANATGGEMKKMLADMDRDSNLADVIRGIRSETEKLLFIERERLQLAGISEAALAQYDYAKERLAVAKQLKAAEEDAIAQQVKAAEAGDTMLQVL